MFSSKKASKANNPKKSMTCVFKEEKKADLEE